MNIKEKAKKDLERSKGEISFGWSHKFFGIFKYKGSVGNFLKIFGWVKNLIRGVIENRVVVGISLLLSLAWLSFLKNIPQLYQDYPICQFFVVLFAFCFIGSVFSRKKDIGSNHPSSLVSVTEVDPKPEDDDSTNPQPKAIAPPKQQPMPSVIVDQPTPETVEVGKTDK